MSIDPHTARQTAVPPIVSLERAAALYDLLAKIEFSGPWGAEYVERYHEEVMRLAQERHRYMGVCGDTIVPVGELGHGPVGRMTRIEHKVSKAASQILDAAVPQVGFVEEATAYIRAIIHGGSACLTEPRPGTPEHGLFSVLVELAAGRRE